MKEKINKSIAFLLGIFLLITSVLTPTFAMEEPFLTLMSQEESERWDNIETFDNFPGSGIKYTSYSFTGVNDIHWKTNGSRDQDTYQIDERGVILRSKEEDNSFIKATFPKGIGRIKVDLRKAYKGKTKRNYGLYIDGELSSQIEVPNSGEENSDVVNLFADVNKKGPVTVEIKRINPNTSSAQVTIDNIRWTNCDSDKADISEGTTIPKNLEERVSPNDSKTDLEKDTNLLTIEEVREKDVNEEVTTKGIITAIDSNSVFIEDSDRGIAIYPQESLNGAKLYDEVEVSGVRGEFNGLKQIQNPKVKVLSSNNIIEPAEVTIEELLNNFDKYESRKILIKSAKVLDYKASDWNIPISQDGKSIVVFDKNSLNRPNELAPNDTIDIKATASMFKKEQLIITNSDDIKILKNGHQEEKIYNSDIIDDNLIKENNAKLIPEVLNMNEGENTTVIGVVAGWYGGGNNLIIQDTVNGEVVGYQIFGPPIETKPGDIVVAEGKVTNFYGLPEMSNIENMKIVGETDAPDPQIITAKEFNINGNKYVNELIRINDLILPEYDGGKGAISFESEDGNKISSYRAPEYPIGSNAGDKVDIIAIGNKHYENYQISINSKKSYILKNDTLAPFVVVNQFQNAILNKDYNFAVNIEENTTIKNVLCNYELNGTKGQVQLTENLEKGRWEGKIPASFINFKGTLKLNIKAIDGSDNVSDGYYENPFVYGESKKLDFPIEIKVDDKPFVESVEPKSGFETKENKRPVIKANLFNQGENPEVTIEINGEKENMEVDGSTATFTPKKDLKDGKISPIITIKRSDGVLSEEFKWSFYVGSSEFKHYYGQLHSHTNYSDGAGTPEEAVEYAKNAEQIDFFAITDHSNYFDTEDNLGRIDDENSGIKSKWKNYKNIIQSYKTDDFLPIYGYEMTWTKTGANYGHINTYNTTGFISRNDPEYNDKQNSKGLLKYYDLLASLDENTFSQFNHPGSIFGTFDDFGHFDKKYNENIKLVEVGNGEGQIGSNGYFRSINEYTKALDKGWKLSPSNNQDNHKGKWGNANTARNVAIARSLTYDEILDAVKNNRWYSTEDNNLRIDYYVNENIMGSKIEPTNNLKVRIEAHDPDEDDIISKIEIVSNGGNVVYSKENNSNSINDEVTVNNSGTYYYLKLTEKDGDIAVTSPVWTGEIKNTGIDSINKDTEIEEVGKATHINAVFNSEEGKKISKIQYINKSSGNVIKEVSMNKTLKAGKNNIDEEIIFREEGIYELEMKVFLEGEDEPYTKSIKVNVYPKDMKTNKIEEVFKLDENKQVMIEGRLTSNASGFDKNTAFFDSAYVEDESGGINIFPISGKYEEGQKVRIKGYTSSYQGEHQINISSIEVIDENIEKINPKKINTGDVPKNLGFLVKVNGIIKKIDTENALIKSIIINDGSGDIRVFIDGYIGRFKSEDKSMPNYKIGEEIETTGLSSIDPEGNRIRIRNRDDIEYLNKKDSNENQDENPEGRPNESPKEKPNEKPYEKSSEENNTDDKIEKSSNSNSSSSIHSIKKHRSKSKVYYVNTNTKSEEKSILQESKNEVKKSNSNFRDVKKSDWFSNYVDYVYKNELMVGTSKNEFGPEDNVKRVMIVEVLYRLSGENSKNIDLPFDDIDENAYYINALKWAYENNIVKGITENKFGPDENLKREELVTLIYRYSLYKNTNLEQNEDLKKFKDSEEISDYAKDAFSMAVKNNLVTGYEDLTLKPKKSITRAELAKIISDFHKIK